jgi:hypothetical protein
MPAIKATATIDATQWDQGLRKMETSARASAGRVVNNFRTQSTSASVGKQMGQRDAKEYADWWGKTLKEKEIRNLRAAAQAQYAQPTASTGYFGGVRGGFGRARGMGGAASAMFVSVARDSAASLASGANPLTVAMQQGPQVLQAFTMMGMGLRGMLAAVMPLSAALVSLTNVVMLAKTAHDASKAKDEAEITEMGASSVSRSISGKAITGLFEEVRRGRITREEADKYINPILAAGKGADPTKFNQAHFDASRTALERLRQIRADDPNKEEQKSLDELDKLQKKMFVNTLTGIEKEKLEARLAYDERKAQIADLAARGGTNQTNTAYRLAEDEYAIQMREIDERYKKPSNATGIRFGSRNEFPAAFRNLPDHVISIAKDMKTVAENSKPQADNTGVRF